MIDIIIGNICSLCAMVSDTISGTRKKKNEILAVQIISQVFYGVGTLVLKGYSGVVQNAVGILRNLAAIRNINNKLVEWTLVILGVLLGVAFNNRGVLGLLPVVANLGYSIAVFQCKNNEKVQYDCSHFSCNFNDQGKPYKSVFFQENGGIWYTRIIM